jgi:hypothetical protein
VSGEEPSGTSEASRGTGRPSFCRPHSGRSAGSRAVQRSSATLSKGVSSRARSTAWCPRSVRRVAGRGFAGAPRGPSEGTGGSAPRRSRRSEEARDSRTHRASAASPRERPRPVWR